MKAKITKGNYFRGVLEYALNPKKGAEIIGGNMIGNTPGDLAKEFEAIAKLKKIKKPVYHKSLSQPPGNENELSDEKWNAIVKFDLEKSGFDADKTQFVIIRHRDKEHDHVHVIINKVNCEGQVFKDSNDVYKAIETTQEIERKFGLVKTAGRTKPDRKKATRAEREKAKRQGIDPPRERLQNMLDAIFAAGKPISARELKSRLETQGVVVYANIARTTGKMNGFAYQLDGIFFKSSGLGKKYTYQSLQKRGLTFDQADRNAFSSQKSSVDAADVDDGKAGGRELERGLPEQTQAASTAARNGLSAEEARKARATFSHIVTALQFKRPGHDDLRQSLPPLLLHHANRIVELKDYPAQQRAATALLESNAGMELADMLSKHAKQQSVSRRQHFSRQD